MLDVPTHIDTCYSVTQAVSFFDNQLKELLLSVDADGNEDVIFEELVDMTYDPFHDLFTKNLLDYGFDAKSYFVLENVYEWIDLFKSLLGVAKGLIITPQHENEWQRRIREAEVEQIFIRVLLDTPINPKSFPHVEHIAKFMNIYKSIPEGLMNPIYYMQSFEAFEELAQTSPRGTLLNSLYSSGIPMDLMEQMLDQERKDVIEKCKKVLGGQHLLDFSLTNRLRFRRYFQHYKDKLVLLFEIFSQRT